MLLFLAAVAAVIWANSPASGRYEALWSTSVPLAFSEFTFTRSLHFWINDGLMTLFFLLVGLEIRREMHDGALVDRRVALLPVGAALGGVLMPALLYLAVNHQPEAQRGWAVPIATDIAFAVGVLMLLGTRLPRQLRVLLLTLAIADDIAAILVIAFAYSQGISVEGLVIAACGVVVVLGLQALGARAAWAYILPGVIVWVGLFRAGVHPTLTGVVLGLLTPVRQSTRVEATLHPWVANGVMPLFALANAGVHVPEWSDMAAGQPSIGWGILLGLVLGKPIGIVLASVLLVRLRACELPAGVTWHHMAVLGCLGGIGFTMSIFIADLAFSNPVHLALAKMAVLAASALSAVGGLILGQLTLRATTGRRPGPRAPT